MGTEGYGNGGLRPLSRDADWEPQQDRNWTILGEGEHVLTERWANNNVLTVGTSGSGKSRYFIRPNIEQMDSSFVIVEPKGDLYRQTAPGLRAAGYDVHLFDFRHPERSTDQWNILSHATTAKQIQSIALQLAETASRSDSDPVWQHSAANLIESYIHAVQELSKFSPDMEGVLELNSIAESPYAQDRDEGETGGRYQRGYNPEPDDPLVQVMRHTRENQEDCDRIDRETRSALRTLREKQDMVQHARSALRSAVIDLRGQGGKNIADQLISQLDCSSRNDRRAWNASLGDETPSPADLHEPEAMAYQQLEAACRERDRAQRAYAMAREQQPRQQPSVAYDMFMNLRSSASDTWRSVRFSASVPLDKLRDPGVLAMLKDDDRAFDPTSLGMHKTALFIVVSDTDKSLYPLVGVIVTQLVEALVDMADDMPEGDLPVPVRFVLDDFATMEGGAWGNVEDWANATRSRGIWWTIAIQGLSQLDDMLGEARARSVLAACNQQVYLGAPNDLVTAAYIARLTGETERDILKTPSDSEVILSQGRGARRARIFDPETHPNQVFFEFWRMRAEREARGRGAAAR